MMSCSKWQIPVASVKNSSIEKWLALLESPYFHEGVIYREWMEDELVLASRSPLPKVVTKENLMSYWWL